MEGRYTKLAQQAFGAPGIDTPAGTQALIDEMRRTYHLDELSALSLRYSSGTVTTSSASSATSEVEAATTPNTPASESTSEGIDIGSLPHAEDEAKVEAAAAKPTAARPAAVAKASSQSTKPAIPTHLHLDTDAMRAALERSKARNKKSKASEAQQYDPLFNSQQ